MRRIVLLVLGGLVLLSCRFFLFSDKDQIAVMETAFNSAMKQDSGLNSSCYWIDSSVRKHFSKAAISAFLKANQHVSIVNSDSLFDNDSTWLNYGYLPQVLLKMNYVHFYPRSVNVSLDKVFSTDGSDGIEIKLSKDKNGFEVISSRITWTR